MSDEGDLSPNRRPGKSEAAFRTISEVSDELNVSQHVLRFWESKFPQVKPMKRGGGRRYYRPEDVILLGRIRDLLYAEGYTIKGVQKLLREGGHKRMVSDVAPAAQTPDIFAPTDGGLSQRFIEDDVTDDQAEPETTALDEAVADGVVVDMADDSEETVVIAHEPPVLAQETATDNADNANAEPVAEDSMEDVPLPFFEIKPPAQEIVVEPLPVSATEIAEIEKLDRAELRAILTELQTLQSLLQNR